ncbi:hypothetical protein TNCV_1306191 [Trichonephila clavipes]|nr:hypothetical protein TNCV_1306191 [Trichonephila clavipes]
MSTDVTLEQEKELENAIFKYDMEKYRPFIELSGCTSVVSLIKVWGQNSPESLPSLPNAKIKKDFTAKVQKLKQHLILRRWLKKKDLFELKEL